MRCRANKRRLFFLNRFQFSPTKPEKFVSNHRLLVNINVAINQLYWTGRIILKWFRKISVEKITSRLQIWFWTTFFKDFLYFFLKYFFYIFDRSFDFKISCRQPLNSLPSDFVGKGWLTNDASGLCMPLLMYEKSEHHIHISGTERTSLLNIHQILLSIQCF